MKTLLSKLDDWELADDEGDLRGRDVVDAAGRTCGRVRDLLVDTDVERAVAVVLEDGKEVPLASLVRHGDRLSIGQVLRASEVAEGAEPAAKALVEDERHVVVPVAEEQVSVGKRVTPREAVRVESRVVEEPRTEETTLREEHVDVERRPANREATPADLQAEEKIDVVATKEIAVVRKRPKVVEEVIVSKAEAERREAVRETARRTEVRVDPARGRPRGGRPPAGR